MKKPFHRKAHTRKVKGKLVFVKQSGVIPPDEDPVERHTREVAFDPKVTSLKGAISALGKRLHKDFSDVDGYDDLEFCEAAAEVILDRYELPERWSKPAKQVVETKKPSFVDRFNDWAENWADHYSGEFVRWREDETLIPSLTIKVVNHLFADSDTHKPSFSEYHGDINVYKSGSIDWLLYSGVREKFNESINRPKETPIHVDDLKFLRSEEYKDALGAVVRLPYSRPGDAVQIALFEETLPQIETARRMSLEEIIGAGPNAVMYKCDVGGGLLEFVLRTTHGNHGYHKSYKFDDLDEAEILEDVEDSIKTMRNTAHFTASINRGYSAGNVSYPQEMRDLLLEARELAWLGRDLDGGLDLFNTINTASISAGAQHRVNDVIHEIEDAQVLTVGSNQNPLINKYLEEAKELANFVYPESYRNSIAETASNMRKAAAALIHRINTSGEVALPLKAPFTVTPSFVSYLNKRPSFSVYPDSDPAYEGLAEYFEILPEGRKEPILWRDWDIVNYTGTKLGDPAVNTINGVIKRGFIERKGEKIILHINKIGNVIPKEENYTRADAEALTTYNPRL